MAVAATGRRAAQDGGGRARQEDDRAGRSRRALERVPGPGGPDPPAPGHQVLQLRDRRGPVEALGAERDIAGPVRSLPGQLFVTLQAEARPAEAYRPGTIQNGTRAAPVMVQ